MDCRKEYEKETGLAWKYSRGVSANGVGTRKKWGFEKKYTLALEARLKDAEEKAEKCKVLWDEWEISPEVMLTPELIDAIVILFPPQPKETLE